MNDEELRDYLKRFCFGREHLICSRDLVRQKNLRESDLRKKVNRLRRKAVPIASSRGGALLHHPAAQGNAHRSGCGNLRLGAGNGEILGSLGRGWPGSLDRLSPGSAARKS